MKLPDKEQIKKAQKGTPWDFGNKILYDLCKNHFLHDNDEIILTKVLFIGRIYAAAIERRKNKKQEISDNFYIDKVIPLFKDSELDRRLSKLKNISSVTINDIEEILQTHKYLTGIIHKITDLDKRSFSSKYLHFHLPELFFMYDGRTVNSIRQFVRSVPSDLKNILQSESIDYEYAKYFCKCYYLKSNIENEYHQALKNRDLDNLLIEIANQ